MQAKTVVLPPEPTASLVLVVIDVIQLYHAMASLVMTLFKSLTSRRASRPNSPGPSVLPAYADETSPLFSDRERAALRFTDAVTRYSEAQGGMPLEPLLRARQHLSEPEIAAVTAAAAAQHFFNPITGALGADATPWGAPVGSQLRAFWL